MPEVAKAPLLDIANPQAKEGLLAHERSPTKTLLTPSVGQMPHPVQDERVEALIEKKDLERGPCSRIAVTDRTRIVEQTLENHKTYILSFGYEIRTLSL